MHATVRLSVVALAFLITASPARGQLRYNFIELGALPGGNTTGSGINNAGAVTGQSGNFSAGQAFLHDGQLENLNTLGFTSSVGSVINEQGIVGGIGYFGSGANQFALPFRYTPQNGSQIVACFGGQFGEVSAINKAGDMTGYWATGVNSGYRAYLITIQGQLTDLGTFGGQWSSAAALNESRQVVGHAYTAGSPSNPRAFLWQNGVLTNLGTFGGDSSFANDINDSGVVVGTAYNAQGYARPFRYTSATGMVELPLPPDAVSGSAEFINDMGHIAGTWVDDMGGARAFRYTPATGSVDLGNPGDENAIFVRVRAMNAKGEIVGHSLTQQCIPSGFVWTPSTGMLDLNDSLIGTLGWRIYDVNAVNDGGQIVVTGANSYYSTALLTPRKPRAAGGQSMTPTGVIRR